MFQAYADEKPCLPYPQALRILHLSNFKTCYQYSMQDMLNLHASMQQTQDEMIDSILREIVRRIQMTQVVTPSQLSSLINSHKKNPDFT